MQVSKAAQEVLTICEDVGRSRQEPVKLSSYANKFIYAASTLIPEASHRSSLLHAAALLISEVERLDRDAYQER